MATSKELAILISGSDKASPALRQLQKDLQGVGTATGQVSQEGKKTADAMTKVGTAGGHAHAGMSKASQGALAMQSAMSGAGQSALAMQVGMFGLGAAAAFMGAKLAKDTVSAGISFETAFAGVRKTVDATEEEFAQLSGGIRQMAKEMPASREQIARVAEAAGQLGIQKESILGFTRTMADLGATTNMSADQAATSLARLANITQMPQSQFDRLGSTVVDLGNKFATTEAEIVEMGLRIAGAGEQIGLSEAQILGWGAALSSVGINAEAGGSAISRTFIDMAVAVNDGGKQLDLFAKVADMASDQFVQKFKVDANAAAIAFVEGLGRMKAEGEDVFAVLEDLGLSEIRQRDALLRLSGANDLVSKTTRTASDAWKENIALTTEAEKRYTTTASKIEVMKSKWSDLAVNGFEKSQPAVVALVEGVGNLADALLAVVQAAGEVEQATGVLSKGLELTLGPLGRVIDAAAEVGRRFDDIGSKYKELQGVLPADLAAKLPGYAPFGTKATGKGGLKSPEMTEAADIAPLLKPELYEMPTWVIDDWEHYWEVRNEGAKAAEEAEKKANQEAKKFATEAQNAFESLTKEARNLARTMDDEVAQSISNLARINEDAGNRWITKWGDIDAAIRQAQQTAQQAKIDLWRQEDIAGDVGRRRTQLSESLSNQDRIFNQRMDDEEFHHREALQLAAIERREKETGDHEAAARAREQLRLEHLAFDEEVKWRIQQEDKVIGHRKEQDRQRAELESTLHAEEIKRRLDAIDIEAEKKIKAANDEWTKFQADEAAKTAKLAEEEKARAASKLTALKEGYFDKLADSAAGGLDGLKAQIESKFGESIAAVTGGGSESSGGGGDGGGWVNGQYVDPRHQPGGDIFETWKANEPGQYAAWAAEHSFAQGGIVGGALGAPTVAVVHGGERITPPGQGGGVIININGPVLGSDPRSIARELARLVEPELNRRQMGFSVL